MVEKVPRAPLLKYLHSIAYSEASLPKMINFRHLFGCDTVEMPLMSETGALSG